jgi:hypothetical protein
MALTPHSRRTIFVATLLALMCVSAWAEELQPIPAANFAQNVVPFLQTHCTVCHGGKEPEAKLALDRYSDSAKIQTEIATWEKVLRIIESRQMPPADEPQPTEAEYQAFARAVEVEIESFDCSTERHPGRVTLRRLNRAEYNNTIRALVGVDFRPADDFPADDVGNGFDNIGDVLSIPPILLEKYLAAAERIVDEAYADPALRKRLLPFEATTDDERRTLTRRNIADFATRAFRRPVTDEELDRLNDIRRAARTLGLTDDEITKGPYQAILSSPHFLFRVERDPGPKDADGIRALDDYELATRLSFFLWSSMPDAELFDLAKKGELHKPDVLEAQARRMLQDPQAQALVDNFAGQWLQLRDIAKITPDPERFPGFNDDLRTAMLQETQLFFAAIIREDRSVLDFLAADFTFVNGRLAKHYGVDNVTGDEFQRVSLKDRRGILTQASILALTSNPTRTSPVKRGKWILENILGEPPPPPPAGVEELKDDEELLGTLRERMQQHRSNPSCAVCHTHMDTLGFGLENFDAIGSWRTKDGRFDIDPSGSLPGGKEFRDAGELMQLLARQKKDAFCRCLAEKMLTYALGRGLGSFDRCAVRAILQRMRANEFRVSALVAGIVTSDPFRFREAKGEP